MSLDDPHRPDTAQEIRDIAQALDDRVKLHLEQTNEMLADLRAFQDKLRSFLQKP